MAGEVSRLVVLLGLASLVVCDGVSWDYMLFEQQWAPGVCLTEHEKTCTIPSNASTGFTIHGCWPSYLSHEGPFYCNNSYSFSEQQIQDILPAMDNYWPSLYGSNEPFWSHEWSKHGTCALSALSDEHGFFSFVIDLRKKNDVRESLSKAGIVPGSKGYQLDTMEKAVHDDIGVTPLFMCSQAGMDEGQVLVGAGLCVNQNLALTECDPSVKGSCQRELAILYAPHRE